MKTCHIALIAAIAAVAIFCCMKKKKSEPYRDLFVAKDIPNDEMIARPTFQAQLAPRIDPFRSGAYNKLNGYLPNISMMATPENPLGNGSLPINGDKVDYSKMGNSADVAIAEADCASAKLKKYDSVMSTTASNSGTGGSSREKFSMAMNGMNMKMNGNMPSSPINGSQLEYTDPKDLLPQPDMASILTKDPTDPNVFNYDRTLFSKLKRRNRNQVDFIRGDLPIFMDKKGWFDVAAVPGTDLEIGAMNIIAPSMEEQTQLQDLVYTRYDHQYPEQAKVVSGDMEYRFN
jgi:hypothetical protein